MGTKNFVALCHKLEAKYGSRFTPPKLLEDMAPRARPSTAASRRRRRRHNLCPDMKRHPEVRAAPAASLEGCEKLKAVTLRGAQARTSG